MTDTTANLRRLALEDADALDRTAEEADENQWPDWSATMRQSAERIRALAAQPSAGARGELTEDIVRAAYLTYTNYAEFPYSRSAMREAIQSAITAIGNATPAKPDTGYTDAFYQLADMMGLPASPKSPRYMWETVMRPRLQDLLAQPDTGDVLAGESYFETGVEGEWKVRRPARTFDDLIADLHRRADSCHDLNKPDQTEHARGRLHGKEGAYRHAADMVRELKALCALEKPDTGDMAALRHRVSSEIKVWADVRWPPSCRVGSKGWVDGLTSRILAALSKPNAPGAA